MSKYRNKKGIFKNTPVVLSEEIFSRYKLGEKTTSLSKEYKIDRHTIVDIIRRLGGKVRDRKESRLAFPLLKQKKELRNRYEAGENTKKLAKEYEISPDAIIRAIRAAGGKIKRQKYFRNSFRETQLKTVYGLLAVDTDWLHERQKGLCLWCQSVLPSDSLKCAVDHIGGRKNKGKREAVRGLCCWNGHCNRWAGMVESNHIKAEGLLKSFVEHVKRIVRYNKGNLPFPENLN